MYDVFVGSVARLCKFEKIRIHALEFIKNKSLWSSLNTPRCLHFVIDKILNIIIIYYYVD